MLNHEFDAALREAAKGRSEVLSLLQHTDIYEIAETLYGSADERGNELVPGGHDGHVAVAKLIAKQPLVFRAMCQLIEYHREQENRLERSAADEHERAERLESAVKAAMEREARHIERAAELREQRDRENASSFRHAARAAQAEARVAVLESVMDVFRDLYGETMLQIAYEAAETRRERAAAEEAA